MPKQRDHALDLLKCLAIFMVCAYHFSTTGSVSLATLLVAGINSVCVPLFFTVNGALMFQKPFDAMQHIKLCGKILLQYFAWKFITLVAVALLRGVNLWQVGWIHTLNVVFFFGEITDLDIAHLWFIPMLLSIYLLFPFFKLMFDQLDTRANALLYGMFLATLFLASMLSTDGNVFKLFLPYIKVLRISSLQNFSPFQGLASAILVYFLLGGLLQKYRATLRRIPLWILLAGYLLGMGSLYAEYHIATNLWHQPAYDLTFVGYNTACTALMVCSLFLLAQRIPPLFYQKTTRLLSLVGGNTLGIYYLHWLFATAFALYIAPHCMAYFGLGFNTLRALSILTLSVCTATGMKHIPFLRHLLQ